MGAAALWVLSKSLSEITAVFQEKNSVKTLKSLDEVTMKPIYQLNPSAKSNIRCLAMKVKSLSLTEQRGVSIIALFKTNQLHSGIHIKRTHERA